MASFPALLVQPPAQQDVLGNLGKVAALKSLLMNQAYQAQAQPLQLQQLQAQAQMTQLAMKQQQMMMDIAPQYVQKDSNGNLTGFDQSGFYNALEGSGVFRPDQVMQMRGEYAKGQSEITNAGKAAIDLLKDKNTQAYNIMQSFRDVAADPKQSPDQVQQGYQGMLNGLGKLGVDTSAFPQSWAQFGVQGLDQQEIKLGMHAQQLADAKTAAETFEQTQRGKELQAQMAAGGTPGMQEARYIQLQQKAALGGPNALTPEEQAYTQAVERYKNIAAQFRVENRTGPMGTWQMVEGPHGEPLQMNTVSGEVRPAPAGVNKPGTYAKTMEPAQQAIDYATNYANNKNFTGSGDEALMEKFFELAKPSTGFRMSQPQIDMLKNAQGWRGSVEAKIRHAATGVWFSDTQRQQIISTMGALAKAKGVSAGAQAGGGAPGAAPTPPPGGAPNWGTQFGGTPH